MKALGMSTWNLAHFFIMFMASLRRIFIFYQGFSYGLSKLKQNGSKQVKLNFWAKSKFKFWSQSSVYVYLFSFRSVKSVSISCACDLFVDGALFRLASVSNVISTANAHKSGATFHILPTAFNQKQIKELVAIGCNQLQIKKTKLGDSLKGFLINLLGFAYTYVISFLKLGASWRKLVIDRVNYARSRTGVALISRHAKRKSDGEVTERKRERERERERLRESEGWKGLGEGEREKESELERGNR